MDSQQAGVPEAYNSGSGSGHSILITVALVVLLAASLAFGGWAFSKMQDYKKNSDQKSAAAVAIAKRDQAALLQTQFQEQNKSPNRTFQGSPTYGSITFNYPKTWSGYVDTSGSNEPINGYFHPDIVPGTQSKTAYALRVELLSTEYSQVLQQYGSQITAGTLTSRAYVPPKMQGTANVVPGTYMSGQINNQDNTQRGNMVVIKVRDKTLIISSQSASFSGDFNDIVLASLKFVP